MTLLQRILEMVEEDNVKNADIADKGDRKNSPKDTKTTISEALKINNLEKSAKNAVNVACMREVENHLPSSSSSKNKKNNYLSLRASNNVSKLQIADCDNCPASGFWDYKGPGKWCFYRAYFLGKAGHPRSCDTARHGCPLNGG
jgi:hypothetical protein